MLEIADLHAAYGRCEVLRGLSLAVRAHERVAVLGPNGVGKTTLLRCVLGQVPCRGTVLVDGIDALRDGARARRRVGYVPQLPAFPPGLAAGEVVAFFQQVRGLRAEPRPLLERVGLAAAAQHPAATLSGGMRRRLALAVALIGEPRLLLLDEPASSLDPSGEAELHRWLARLRDEGAAVLLTGHDPRTLDRVADRVALLSGGRVVLDRPVAVLLGERRVRLRLTGPAAALRVLREAVGPRTTADPVLNGAVCLALPPGRLPDVLRSLPREALRECRLDIEEVGLEELVAPLLSPEREGGST